MKRKYGIMLIGCGHIGGEHLEDIYYREEFSIEAVIDQDGERAVSYTHLCPLPFPREKYSVCAADFYHYRTGTILYDSPVCKL